MHSLYLLKLLIALHCFYCLYQNEQLDTSTFIYFIKTYIDTIIVEYLTSMNK